MGAEEPGLCPVGAGEPWEGWVRPAGEVVVMTEWLRADQHWFWGVAWGSF